MDWRSELFKMPKWVKPEVNTIIYWVHLAILASVALALLQWWKGGEMLTFWNVVYSLPVLAAGDLAAHTILQLD